jgi:Leu/Phe-tRNA-protein transferase
MEAVRRQQNDSQTGLAHDITNLKQQLTQLSGAQSSSEKKIAEMGAQLVETKQEAGNLKQ